MNQSLPAGRSRGILRPCGGGSPGLSPSPKVRSHRIAPFNPSALHRPDRTAHQRIAERCPAGSQGLQALDLESNTPASRSDVCPSTERIAPNRTFELGKFQGPRAKSQEPSIYSPTARWALLAPIPKRQSKKIAPNRRHEIATICPAPRVGCSVLRYRRAVLP